MEILLEEELIEAEAELNRALKKRNKIFEELEKHKTLKTLAEELGYRITIEEEEDEKPKMYSPGSYLDSQSAP